MASQDVKIKSTEDELGLVGAIHDRFLDLCDLYQRVNKVKLVPSPEVMEWLKTWRQVFKRYELGDYRHTISEMNRVKLLAQWTVDVKREICKKEKLVIAWKE